MKYLSFFLVIVFLTITTPFSLAQVAESSEGTTSFVLLDGTPIKLRLGRNLSSADAKTGETVDFEVLEEVKIGDVVIVPREGIALATITHAKPKGRMGKGGKLDLTIDYVRLVSSEKAALRAVKETKGGSKTGTMTGAMVAAGILFFPAAPFFLFMKGKDIKIPKGAEVTAYINGDVPLDRKKFVSEQANADILPDNNKIADSGASSISIKSNPEGAEIWINGKFMGNTPSTLNLPPGDHIVVIRHPGYVTWERSITSFAGGNVTVNAELEPQPSY